MTLGEKINAANAEALKIILGAQPTLIGVGTAGEDIPGMTKKTILHSGPPVTWENMCDPTKGAVIGALIYEGLAKTPEEAEKLAASGEITFDPCHHHNAVGPMCGIVSYSMPVWKVINKAHGNMAYCTFNEGLGKVLRFGAYDDTVITRLHWLRNEFYPVIKEALEIRGEIDLKVLIAQELQMGDDGHNRNRAGTSLLIRELAPAIVKTHFDQDVKVRALEFLNSNDHTWLNLTMPACKCTMDAIEGIEYCSLVYTMCRNGTEFGVRVAGLPGQWFHYTSEKVEGLYFPGFTEADANRDVGDSCITETTGIGGFCMAAAPAIVKFVGGTVADSIKYSTEMYEITEGQGTAYQIPALGFRGSATGIDIRKVIETGIRPVINTGIACNRRGVGQVGAGVVHPPMECFEQAIEAFVAKYAEG